MQPSAASLTDAGGPLAQLRAATRDRHAYLDSSLWLDGATTTRVAYGRHIAAVTALYRDAERAIAPYAAELTAAGLLGAERHKLPALEAEWTALRACGCEAPEHPTAVPFPAIENLSAAVGCTYVLEGSTLGGTLIAKRILERLTWQSSFYGIYGERTAAMWRAFTAAIEAQRDRVDPTALTTAACAMFDAYAIRVAGLTPVL